jgi:hypothetical protein
VPKKSSGASKATPNCPCSSQPSMPFNLTPGLVPDDNLFVPEPPAAFQRHTGQFQATCPSQFSPTDSGEEAHFSVRFPRIDFDVDCCQHLGLPYCVVGRF